MNRIQFNQQINISGETLFLDYSELKLPNLFIYLLAGSTGLLKNFIYNPK